MTVLLGDRVLGQEGAEAISTAPGCGTGAPRGCEVLRAAGLRAGSGHSSGRAEARPGPAGGSCPGPARGLLPARAIPEPSPRHPTGTVRRQGPC